MSDIVHRLYDRQVCSLARNACRNDSRMEEAADAITALRAEVERLTRANAAMMNDTVQMGMAQDHAVADLRAAEAERDRLRDAALTLVRIARQNTDDGDEWEAAIVAVERAAMRPAEGWRPIETAPKGGTKVDLWGYGYRHIDMVWIDSSPLYPAGSWSRGDWAQAIDPAVFTHWMPAPAAPAQGGEDERG